MTCTTLDLTAAAWTSKVERRYESRYRVRQAKFTANRSLSTRFSSSFSTETYYIRNIGAGRGGTWPFFCQPTLEEMAYKEGVFSSGRRYGHHILHLREERV